MTNKARSYKATRAADPTALQPIPQDPRDNGNRVCTAPRAWQADRWALARAYVQAELYRTHRTVSFCSSLAYQAMQRLGISITG